MTAAGRNEGVDKLTLAIRRFETKLLEAFREYDDEHATWARALTKSHSVAAKHLAALEERVLNLETRRGPGSR
jgi:hypothetical protein